MNPGQLAQQIKHELEQVRWPFGGEDLVFGSKGCVAVFAGTPTQEQIPLGFPWCLVGIGDAQHDGDEPSLLTQTFRLVVASNVPGDRLGERAIIGGPIVSLGRSANRGVAEVTERVLFAVQSLTGADGARIIVSGVQSGEVTALGDGKHMAMCEVQLQAWCTTAPEYAAPQHLRHVSGQWLWSGPHCSDRFDFMRYRLCRIAGDSPPTNPDDGTLLYTGTAAAFTGAATPGYTYAAFADYNSRGGTLVEGFSGNEIGSFRVVA